MGTVDLLAAIQSGGGFQEKLEEVLKQACNFHIAGGRGGEPSRALIDLEKSITKSQV